MDAGRNPATGLEVESPAWTRVARLGGMVLVMVAVAIGVAGPTPVRLGKGTVAPPLRLATLGGERVDLSAYRGKPMLLNFFATWCGPCRAEIPDLNAAHEALGKDVTVVGVLVFSGLPPDVEAPVGKMGIRYPVWVTDDETAAAWQVSAVPTAFLVDGAGVIRWTAAGGVDQGDIRAALNAMNAPPGAGASVH